MLLGGAEKMSPSCSIMIAMRVRYVGQITIREWMKDN